MTYRHAYPAKSFYKNAQSKKGVTLERLQCKVQILFAYVTAAADLRDVCQLLDYEVEGLLCIAHAAQHKDLLANHTPGFAQFVCCFQAVALAAD